MRDDKIRVEDVERLLRSVREAAGGVRLYEGMVAAIIKENRALTDTSRGQLLVSREMIRLADALLSARR